MNTLIFFNNNDNQSTGPRLNINKPIRTMASVYSNGKMQPNLAAPVPQSFPSVNEDIVPAKPISWGEPTWFLFHTLAEKIKVDAFSLLRTELLNMIYLICINLPCPDCANHAKSYMNGINFNTILTKDDLKKMLYTFHNSVNERKGFAIFPYDKLEEKYKLAITSSMVNNFAIKFKVKTNNIKLLADELQRTNVIQKFKSWYMSRAQYFDP